MTLEEKFQAAVDIIQKLPKDGPLSTTNDDKLKFYSLFKQATVGDVNTERPAFYQLIEKAKWDAWKSVEGIAKEDAMQEYIDAVNAAFDKAADQVDVTAWLSGDGLDPTIKINLAKINAN